MEEFILNPFHNSVCEGISLFTALKNRQETLEEALKTWVTHNEIDEIIIVDWDSDESLVPLIEKYQNGRIYLAVVKDQPKWILSYAYNLAARLTTKDKILKVDADIKLLPGFFKNHVLTPGMFFTGNWEIARNDNERHLNGTIFIYRADFFTVNGYNEFITSYGWDDSDLYLRIESLGITRQDLNPDNLCHLEHDQRTIHQDRTNFIYGIDDKERTIINIIINHKISELMTPWSLTHAMLDFNIESDSQLFNCTPLTQSPHKIPADISMQCERIAIIERISYFQISLNNEFLDIFTLDELMEIYSICLLKENDHTSKIRFEILAKMNNNIDLKYKSKSHLVTQILPETIINPAYPKITIVTPNLNGGRFLEETILSVIEQNYPNLEYIVIDGGSTDNSIDIIDKYKQFFSYWESTHDNGLFYALQKGFDKSSGDIMGWINSDDVLQRKSLFSVAEIFASNPAIEWVQGYPVVIDELGRIVFHRAPVSSKLAFYLKDFLVDGKFIQQESTFWKKTLWDKTGGHLSTQYKYAGDFELWIRFFNHSKLYITDTVLGAFRMRREAQLSRTYYQDYLNECEKIIDVNMVSLTDEEINQLQKEKRRKYFYQRTPLISRLIFSKPSFLHSGDHQIVNFDLTSFRFK